MRQRGTNVRWCFADCAPVATLGNVEAMNFGEIDRINVTKEFRGLRGLLIPYVTDPLEEEQRQDVCLPVRAVDGASAQNLGAVLEMRLELLERQGHVNKRRVWLRAGFSSRARREFELVQSGQLEAQP